MGDPNAGLAGRGGTNLSMSMLIRPLCLLEVFLFVTVVVPDEDEPVCLSVM